MSEIKYRSKYLREAEESIIIVIVTVNHEKPVDVVMTIIYSIIIMAENSISLLVRIDVLRIIRVGHCKTQVILHIHVPY